jgi:hypothetical protein
MTEYQLSHRYVLTLALVPTLALFSRRTRSFTAETTDAADHVTITSALSLLVIHSLTSGPPLIMVHHGTTLTTLSRLGRELLERWSFTDLHPSPGMLTQEQFFFKTGPTRRSTRCMMTRRMLSTVDHVPCKSSKLLQYSCANPQQG